MKHWILVTAAILFSGYAAQAQKTIEGHVYGGLNQTSPVDSMQIRTSSGGVTYTDTQGFYHIYAQSANDTIFISYKGREIIHYPINFIQHPDKFDIYLQNPAFYDPNYYNVLPEVKVFSRNYHKDSLANREMYANVFDYAKPKFNPFSPITSTVNLFNKSYIKRQERYRTFAENNEKDGYIDSRFTRSFVSKISGIRDDDELTDFMKEYRPSYTQLVDMSQLDLGQYILESYKKYKEAHPGK